MEVHHHPKVEKKNFKEYFLEFLMIFLAVTMGFFAESLREHIADKAKEKEYINSLVSDLDNDIKVIDHQMLNFETSLAQLDSLVKMLKDPRVKEFGADIYYFGRQAAIPAVRFLTNDRTLQQMKNSGSFRLIRNDRASSAIIDYYRNLNLIEVIQTLDINLQNEYRRIAIDIFDPIVLENYINLENMENLEDSSSSERPVGHPALSTYDTKQLARLAGMVAYIRGTRHAYVSFEKIMRKKALKLIELLKKEYHLNLK
ncbi:MAG TPA: hypothetical protein VFU29_19485 [Chitinophagaceae bacterium]|nr:hypothetical protein [Chitinophagaceae bacterium]